MATPTSSGTIGATVFRVSDIVETIARRCGVKVATISNEQIAVIMGVLWRLLAHMSSRGINLWRIYKSLIPLYSGQQVYTMARGDIDVQGIVHRQPIRLSASSIASSSGGITDNLVDGDLTTNFTQSGANGSVVFDWGLNATQQVALIGLYSAAARAYNLVFEISNDGSTWTTVLSPGSVTYAAGSWMWYEIDPTGIPARYFRVRETGGAIMSFGEISLSANWTDIEVARWNIDQWRTNPAKRSFGYVRNYWFDRQIIPQFSVWQTPNSLEQLNLLVAWVHRHIEDVGTMQNLLNIPERWYQPVIDIGAWWALPELPMADMSRAPLLKDIALGTTLSDVEKEERDKATIQLGVAIGCYTK